MDLSADAVSSAEIVAKKSQYKVGNAARDIGSDILRQLFGIKRGDVVPTEGDVKKLDKNDTEFSDKAYAATRAKIIQMYESHRIKRLKEAESARVAQIQQKQAKDFTQLEQTRINRQKRDVAAAIGKNSAETGRSYGAE